MHLKICKFIEGSFIPASDGASVKFSQITKNLSEQSVDLTVIHCYRGWSDLNMISKQNFTTYALPPKYYYHNHVIVHEIIEKIKPDIIEMNDIELIMSTGLYLNKQFHIPLIYDAHFITSALSKSLATDENSVITEKEQEQKLNKIITGAICFTELDRNNLLKITHMKPNKVCVIPLGSDNVSIKKRKIKKTDNEVLFLGNMYFQPNQEAVEYIINQIIPLVLKEIPNILFKFVGDVPEFLISKYSNKHILFTGRITNINKVFDKVRVCIAPIFIGGGMRVKILTYMSAGIPTVASSIGAEGINDLSSLKIADNEIEFSQRILELFNNHTEAVSLAKKASTLIRNEYSWKNITKKCIAFYKEVLKEPINSNIEPISMEHEPFWLLETIKKNRFPKKVISKHVVYKLGYGKKEVTNIIDVT